MILVGIRMLLAGFMLTLDGDATTLGQQLSREGASALARAAAADGDPRRGAIVFYQPQLSCASCHVQGQSDTGVGPDLTAPGKNGDGGGACRGDS